jgi:DNA replication protein DnaC
MRLIGDAAARLKAKLEGERGAHPERFRQLSPEEYAAQRYEYLHKHLTAPGAPPNELRYCGLYQDEIDNLTWDKVKVDVSGGLLAVQTVRAFYVQGYGMVYLGGTPGQAKTLLLKIAVATATRAGMRARYVDLRDVLQNLRASFQREYHNDEFSARMNDWIEMPVLALDEIDKCNETPWAREQVFYLIDKRYTGAVRQISLTILAGNQTGDEMAVYISSRLKDDRGAFVVLDGPDGRRVMSKDNKY